MLGVLYMQADAISLAPDREQTPAEKLAQHRAEQDLTLRLIRDKTIGLAVVLLLGAAYYFLVLQPEAELDAKGL